MADLLIEALRRQLAIIGDAVLEAQKMLVPVPAPPVSDTVLVRAGENLQAACRQGAQVEVEAGARFPGTLVLANDVTVTFREGAGMEGGAVGPAIAVPPGVSGWTIVGGVHASRSTEAVVQVGENTAKQTTRDAQPSRGILRGLSIPRHRGKRAIALHGSQLLLEGLDVRDVWSAQDYDSQAIYIGNAAGQITVRGCHLEAGSQVILSGGDELRTPGLHPTGLIFEGNALVRPLAWMTDANSTKRRIKNSFELKDGLDVVFRGNIVRGNWNDPRTTQGAYAVMLTPALDGAIKTPPLTSGLVGNVLIEGNDFLDIGAGINCLGRHYTAITDPALYGVVVKDNRWRINRTQFGGFGQFLKLGNEPGDITVDGNTILQDGGSHVYLYKGTVLDPVTVTSRPGGKLGALIYQNNVAELGDWGFNLDGSANASRVIQSANIGTVQFAGNTFKGATRTNITARYLGEADFNALEAVRRLRLFP